MKKVVFTLTLLVGWLISSAQYTQGGGGAFSFGMQTLPGDRLKAFAPDGPSVSETNFSWGGYGYWQKKNWVFGLKGAGVYGRELIDDLYTYKVTGGYFMLDFGYKVINKKKFSLYPFLGFGSGGVNYTISSKYSIDLADQGTDKPVIYSGTYNWGSLAFDIGFRIEQLFALKQKQSEYGGGLVGIEVGYMFTPTNNDWRTVSNATIINAPDFNMNGIYARVLIGGFGGN